MTAESTGAAPDLSRCATEPIHIPGAIQPHGVLLALDPANLTVRQTSDNAEAILGIPVQRLLGAAPEEWLDEEQAVLLRDGFAGAQPHDKNPLPITIAGASFDGLLHRADDLCLLELEPCSVAQTDLRDDQLQHVLSRLAASEAMPQLLDTLALVVRDLTGFDRVVVYRFDEDDHGHVAAEARDDEVEPYLGLHYPESDIPRQARELYRRQWIRTIPNAIYVPSRLVPLTRPGTGEPLDLSTSLLRSVSPVHLEYMANMGLQASMSVSLVVEGRLWGLLSCGHRRPRFLSHRLRKACETIGRIASLQITALQTIELRRAQDTKLEMVRQLAELMSASSGDVLDGLCGSDTPLLALTRATGAAVFTDAGVTLFGQTPERDEALRLAEWVQARCGSQGVFHTHRLGEDDARWASLSGLASGVLGLMMPTPQPHGVLWFRPEQVQTVQWAGDPRKAAQAGSGGAAPRLHPRRSFELWKEVVRSRSDRWEVNEVYAAAQLRRSAIELDLGRQVERERAAVQARDDLVAVVSHDLRNPMLVVVMQAALIQRLLAGDLTEPSQRLRASVETIQRAGQRMSSLLGDLLDLSKIEAGRYEISPTPLAVDDMLQDVCELLQSLGSAKRVRLVREPACGLVVNADADRVFQVFSNLIGNAIKVSPEGSEVRIGAKRVEDLCEFWIADQGPGVNPDELPHLFDRYWQARRNRRGGAGLGLYIAKGIVEAHGGTIHADQAPHSGATFRFTLPITSS